MDYDEEHLRSLVQQPRETLAVELKSWIEPQTLEGIAKIASACMAMRNNNGGFLVIGFDDKTCEPDLSNVPSNVREKFHADIIQRIVSKYAFRRFDVDVRFVPRDGQDYPIIC